MEVRVLGIVEDPGTSVRSISAVEVLGVPLLGEFSGNSHFTLTTPCKSKPSIVLTIMQMSIPPKVSHKMLRKHTVCS
jgi:hypothetical protein